MGAQGQTSVNFGSAPGTNQVDVIVSGQASILAGSLVEAWLSPNVGLDHNLEQLKLLSNYVGVFAHSISAGNGFTITVTTDLRINGQVYVNWVWN